MSNPSVAPDPKSKPKGQLQQRLDAFGPPQNWPDTITTWLAGFEMAGDPQEIKDVVEEELAAIDCRRLHASLPPVIGRPPCHEKTEATPQERDPGKESKRPEPTPLAGIALSGGGIRSATFCLGVLQALQERGVLRVFDYLSTVSGGGFAGGWWSAWLSRRPQSGDPPKGFPPGEKLEWNREDSYRTGSAPDVDRGTAMSTEVISAPKNVQDPVHHLRLFSNYLMPRKGLLSADTWRAAAILSRNLVLTWTILLPLLVAVMAVGQIYFLRTPGIALGFVCPPDPKRIGLPPEGCLHARNELEAVPGKLPDSVRARLSDSVRATLPRADTFQLERLSVAIQPVLFLIGLLVVTTLLWLMTAARGLAQLAGIVVGLGATLTLLHALSERFRPPGGPPFHQGDDPWVSALKWVSGIIVVFAWAIPMMLDRHFLSGAGSEDKRDVRTNLITRLHAVLLGSAIATILVLTIGGFAPDFFDFVSRQLKDDSPITRIVAGAGGWLAVLAPLAGTGLTLWSEAPTGGGEGKQKEPSSWRGLLLQVTPVLVLVLLAVLIATLLRYGLAHLPVPGSAARTPFVKIVPITLGVAGGAALVSRCILAWKQWIDGQTPNVDEKKAADRLTVALVGLGGALIAWFIAANVYQNARPLASMEPLGTSTLIAVLLCGFFTIFEYLTDESETPRSTRVGIVLAASMVTFLAYRIIMDWSPLDWATGGTAQLKASTTTLLGGVSGLVLARSMLSWKTDSNGTVLRPRFRSLRDRPNSLAFTFLFLVIGLVVGSFILIGVVRLVIGLLSPSIAGLWTAIASRLAVWDIHLNWSTAGTTNYARTPAAIIVGITIGLVLARCSVGWTTEGGQTVLRSRISLLRNFRGAGAMAVASLALGMVLGGIVAWRIAVSPIPFDADSARLDASTRLFAIFCVIALVFTSAFIIADLCLSRADSKRVLWLQVLTVGLLGPTLMQLFLNPLVPSVQFVNTNLAFAGVAIAMVMGLGWLVDPNMIALHTFYRARLVRAYLGASNPDRKGNVTEASEGDDIQLSALRNTERGGPFHLINTTLNLVGGQDLITAQRSSANFTMSRLHCGSLRTGYRKTIDYMSDRMTLGTALAISGAAASPNMGSKTPSAALAMWLAFLNVRLGFWAPTPSKSRWRTPQARLWPFYLLSECLSQTNDLGSYCYLTDGGHFDNTALYALVERGCRYIVVVDCGADPTPAFGDIGDAVRRCRIDFDAEITLDVRPLQKDEKGLARSHYVVGEIVFSEAHARELNWPSNLSRKMRTGTIVWIKPARRSNDPADVTQYGLEHGGFPQESTGDQFYTEAQFESYRRLGFESASAVVGEGTSYSVTDRLDAKVIFKNIGKRYKKAISKG